MFKLLKNIFPIFIAVFLVSCEGDQGPPGVDGLDGLIGQVFEIEGDFTAANNFTLFSEFPGTIEVLESDVVQVFLLEETVDDGNGGTLDVFTPLPQIFFLDQGQLQYTFNHTFVDVAVILDANFDLTTAPATFTDNQIFRIAVIPAEFAQNSSVDITNLNAIMKAFNIESKEIIRIN